MSSAPLIELINVTKIYGKGDAEVRALDGLHLTIPEGQFLAVMGASGSGKSTCMNMLGCLDVPTSGDHLFRGVEVGRLSMEQRALLRRNYLGFVFQGFNLLARTNARENVELPLIYRGVRAKDRRARAIEALGMVGLAGRETHAPNELSGGQQQRVAIARAMVTNPAVLLADEPTGNLDSQRSDEIMRLLVRLNAERGITIIMVTHDAHMASFAQRIVQFKDGRLLSDEMNARPA
ncbi:MAG: ABC transporter ATP-binding protein [Sandaracinaceae bacterium]|nr:ABC transporter ATP-binding protein [Sandaracinaceae bacterium]